MNLIDYTCYDEQDENYIMMKSGYGWNKNYLFRDGDSRHIYIIKEMESNIIDMTLI